MARHLTLLFRRDPSRDRQKGKIHYRGYRPFWPDGQPVDVGLDAFCQHGQRLLSLNRHLAHTQEGLIQLINFPVSNHEENMHLLPGHRVRRFFIERQGQTGRVHFMDGTPTDVVFHLGKDEPEVLSWLGFSHLRDGERQWFDLAACPVDKPVVPGRKEHRNEVNEEIELAAQLV